MGLSTAMDTIIGTCGCGGGVGGLWTGGSKQSPGRRAAPCATHAPAATGAPLDAAPPKLCAVPSRPPRCRPGARRQELRPHRPHAAAWRAGGLGAVGAPGGLLVAGRRAAAARAGHRARDGGAHGALHTHAVAHHLFRVGGGQHAEVRAPSVRGGGRARAEERCRAPAVLVATHRGVWRRGRRLLSSQLASGWRRRQTAMHVRVGAKGHTRRSVPGASRSGGKAPSLHCMSSVVWAWACSVGVRLRRAMSRAAERRSSRVAKHHPTRRARHTHAHHVRRFCSRASAQRDI